MVELMVALLLSSLLTLGVIQVFIANKTSYRLQEAQSRMQENARFALSIISSELRKAGHLGCVTSNLDTSTGSVLTAPPATFRPWKGIEGWEAVGTPALGVTPARGTAFGEGVRIINNAPVNDASTLAANWPTADGATLDAGTMSVVHSDIIRVWYADSTHGNITALGATPTFSAIDVTAGDVFVINDCGTAQFLQACSAASSTGFSAGACNTTGDITVRDSDSEIRKLKSTVFFVGKRGNIATNPPALFWRELGNNAAAGNSEELVEGVESLQFMYGEDTDNDFAPNAYVPANRVTDWAQVVSVKVSLLMRSVITSGENNTSTASSQNVTTDDQTITFNGLAISSTNASTGIAIPDVPDGRLRRVFTTTIALRNKLI